jgi:transposase
MAMGKREKSEKQQEIWVAAADLPKSASHPFYRRLNEYLDEHGFDAYCEAKCSRFYAAKLGRPGLLPGIYFRLLMLGYFEGLDSERGIAWRASDSLSVRSFLRLTLDEAAPDHSTISRTRRLIDRETHQEIFGWVLKRLAEEDLLKGKTVGIDATLLEANAAMRSIVRRDTGKGYEEFLTELAKASGIETPTREDLARLDRKRKNKASNADWVNPNEPDGRIAKMKDGSTHIAHKVEHAVDMSTGAVVAVVLHEADQGDTTTVMTTLAEAGEAVEDLIDAAPEVASHVSAAGIREVVADKGYLSDAVLEKMAAAEVRTYLPEKQGPKRDWAGKREQCQRARANRRRVRGKRGKALLRKRGELIERSFAHNYETGGMRRTHLRKHPNILKRLYVHTGAQNLVLLMRHRFGVGKPRRLQDQATLSGIVAALGTLFIALLALQAGFRSLCASAIPSSHLQPGDAY